MAGICRRHASLHGELCDFILCVDHLARSSSSAFFGICRCASLRYYIPASAARLSRGRVAPAFALRPALGMVRVAGSNRSGAPVLVVGELGATARHEEPGIDIESDGAVRAGRVGSGHRTRHPRPLRGSGAAPTLALHGIVLHGAGGSGRWIARTIPAAAALVALVAAVCSAKSRNVFCAAAGVSGECAHRVAVGAAAQSVGAGFCVDSRKYAGRCPLCSESRAHGSAG